MNVIAGAMVVIMSAALQAGGKGVSDKPASPQAEKSINADGKQKEFRNRKRKLELDEESEGEPDSGYDSVADSDPLFQQGELREGRRLKRKKVAKTAKGLVVRLCGRLNCLNLRSEGECVDLEVDEQLLSMFSQSWLALSPDAPAYNSIDHSQHLKKMNPELWDRLGLDSVPLARIVNNDRDAAQYHLDQVLLREALARQDEYALSLPFVDVHLMDATGNSFSLSELPQPWLSSPELVNAISAISLHNTGVGFKRAASSLELVRQLFQLISGAGNANNSLLMELLTQCHSQNAPLTMFRDRDDRDIANAVLEVGTPEQIGIVHSHGKIAFNAQDCAVVIKNPSADTGVKLLQLREIFEKENVPCQLDKVETKYGNLLQAGIEKRLDYFSMLMIIDSYSSCITGVIPSVDDFIKALKQEIFSQTKNLTTLCILNHLPKGSFAGWDQWRDSNGKSLLEYILASTVPRVTRLGSLHLLGLPASLNDFSTILSDTRKPEDLWSFVHYYDRKFGSEALKDWRDDSGRTLYELALINNVSAEVLQTITTLTGQKASGDLSEKETGLKRYYWQVQPVQQVHNVFAYQGQLNKMLQENGLQQGVTEKDGLCFYHAVNSLSGVQESSLQAEMIHVIQTAHDDNWAGAMSPSAYGAIMDSIPDSAMPGVVSAINNLEWVELSWLPAVAQALNHLTQDFNGMQVITPGYDNSSTPVITLYQPDGISVQLPGININLPTLIHTGQNHWTFAEPISGIPAMNNSTHSTKNGPENVTTFQEPLQLLPVIEGFSL